MPWTLDLFSSIDCLWLDIPPTEFLNIPSTVWVSIHESIKRKTLSFLVPTEIDTHYPNESNLADTETIIRFSGNELFDPV